jgi:outer membrane PBP1 activator LpoA protein
LAELQPLQDWLEERPLLNPQNILLQPQLTATSATDYFLELAKILYLQGRYETAERLLARLDPEALNPNQRRSYAIIQAYNEWGLNQPQSALSWLQPPYRALLADLPWAQRLVLNQLQAELLSADAQYLAAAQLRHQIYPFLSEPERADWVNALWLDLRSISDLELTLPYALDANWDAWLELVRLERMAAGNLSRLQANLEQWEQDHPNHPAQQYRPTQLVELMRDRPQAPQSIALILPLPDNLTGPGHRILEGFLAGYYHDQQAGDSVPNLRIYHEHSAPVQTLVQLALDEGAELIIGPLDRHNVAELESIGRLPFPILALNRTPRDQGHHPQIIQLALAPEDEAEQVARLARQSGHQVAAIMVPEGDWGDRVATAFTNAWLELDGRLVQRQTLPTRDDGRQYLAQVQTVLDIAQSEQRASNVRAVIGRPIESEPRPRADLDIIFLATNPEQTRQIVSLFNFQLADDIQLMATSAAVASSHSERDQSLSGLWVVETPWRLNSHPLHPTLQAAQEPDAPARFDRLHALGLDAWHLVAQMPYIQQQHWVRFHGQTGVLQLNERQQLVRELSPAEFRSARLVPLARPLNHQMGPAHWSVTHEPPQR